MRATTTAASSVLRRTIAAPTPASRVALHPAPLARALHSSTPRSRSSVNTISVDPRILDGTAGFLPKENVERLVEWQTGLWERLAAEVRNNPALLPIRQKWDTSGLDMTHLLYTTAREPSMTLAFNYASALINNSYFLEGINPSDDQLIPSWAEGGSAALKEKVEAYAEGIIGGGWLWLVRTGINNSDLDILPTFGSGTLLITQRAQHGRDSTPIFGTPSSSSYPSSPPPPAESTQTSAADTPRGPPRNEAAARPKSASSAYRLGGSADGKVLPVPLAVLNLHEMAYLGGKYGVWDRRRYAGDWFRNLDWARVAERTR